MIKNQNSQMEVDESTTSENVQNRDKLGKWDIIIHITLFTF